MKFCFRIMALTVLAAASLGCNAQMPPTTHQVTLNWTMPLPANPVPAGGWAGCGTAPNTCTYVASRLTLAQGKTTCDPVNVATPNYTPLNSASPTSALNYTDAASSGLNVCYTVQTLQAGAYSQPSNVVGPFQVLGTPLAPTLGATQSEVKQPLIPLPSLVAPTVTAKNNGAPVLRATVK